MSESTSITPSDITKNLLIQAAKAHVAIADISVSLTFKLNPPQDGSWGISFESPTAKRVRQEQ